MEHPKGSSEETCPCGRWGSSFTVLSATQVRARRLPQELLIGQLLAGAYPHVKLGPEAVECALRDR